MNQKYNIKLMNVNLLDVMGRVVESHTKHYKTDFDIDTSTLREAAASYVEQDRNFIWLNREFGTWCLNERNVYVTRSWQHNTFCFYREQTPSDSILAFIVEVKGISRFDGTLIGNIYPVDYSKLYDHVKAVCLPATSVLMRYERGELVKPAEKFDGWPDYDLGELQGYKFFLEDEGALRSLLREEKRNREKFTEADVSDFLATL